MTHEERVSHHEMKTCEGIHEHAERIATMKEFLVELYDEKMRICYAAPDCARCPEHVSIGKCLAERLYDHMKAIGMHKDLGIEEDEADG